MPRFHTIDVYPYSGHPGQPWSNDTDADAFAKTARRVCEAYSRTLTAHDLRAKNSTLLLHLDRVSEEHTADLDHVHVLVHTDVWPAALRDPQAVTVRRFTDRVEVHYRTTAPSLQALLDQSGEWARQDLDRAVTKLRKRFRLAPPPDLPHLDEAALTAAQALAELRARNTAW